MYSIKIFKKENKRAKNSRGKRIISPNSDLKLSTRKQKISLKNNKIKEELFTRLNGKRLQCCIFQDRC